MHRKWKTALWVAGLVGGLALYACTKQTVDVQKDKIRASLSTLASDEMEGRAPGTHGGEKASEFIATSFADVGLKPAADGSYLQPVRMVGVAPEDGWVLEWSKDGRKTPLKASDQCVANPGVAEEEVNLEDAPMVFVGYGIVAPEVPWNDYQGADVKGKVVVALVNDPPSDDPTFFGGAALTYYGRWTYKLEEAARQGAAGVILVHYTEMAGYPWAVVQTSWSGEQFTLQREG
ncbi:MAG: peptidase M28, partial [Acidobacteriota bacterium]